MTERIYITGGKKKDLFISCHVTSRISYHIIMKRLHKRAKVIYIFKHDDLATGYSYSRHVCNDGAARAKRLLWLIRKNNFQLSSQKS